MAQSWKMTAFAPRPVIQAVNDAVRRIEQTSSEKMSGLTAGLNLPGGLKLPF